MPYHQNIITASFNSPNPSSPPLNFDLDLARDQGISHVPNYLPDNKMLEPATKCDQLHDEYGFLLDLVGSNDLRFDDQNASVFI